MSHKRKTYQGFVFKGKINLLDESKNKICSWNEISAKELYKVLREKFLK